MAAILFGAIVLLPIRLLGLITLLIGYYTIVKILFKQFNGTNYKSIPATNFDRSAASRAQVPLDAVLTGLGDDSSLAASALDSQWPRSRSAESRSRC
jgi:hypothetical protein